VQCVFQNEYNEGNKISVHSVWSYSAFWRQLHIVSQYQSLLKVM
jgi:hypothetical protein